MTKRRLVENLPAVHQTDTLRRFFGATVDQVFQPGSAEAISGFIGRKPPYNNPSTDFYKAEPTAARQTYQLEPTMVSIDDTGAITRSLFYEDLVNHLATSGAITNNTKRLFEADHYSWSPPVDIDKLTNYQLYYWIEYSAEAVPVQAPSADYTGNSSQTIFALPGTLAGFDQTAEIIRVTVDGATVTNYTRSGNNVIFSEAPIVGHPIKVYRYGNLLGAFQGKQTFDLSLFTDEDVALTSGMRLELHGETVFTVFVDGVGTSITLSVDEVIADTDPVYVVIDRSSTDRSIWARQNRWVHRDAIKWAGQNTAARQAKRPIIEFKPNLRLWNYGTQRVNDITCVMTHTATYSTNQITFAEINGLPIGTVQVDGLHTLTVGDRLLVCVEGTPSLLNNRIYTVGSANDGSTTYYVLDVADVPVYGDAARLPLHGAIQFDSSVLDLDVYDYDAGSLELWFDGTTWKRAQRNSTGYPLFALYDADGNELADTGVYPGSTFAGSRIFGFAPGDSSAAADAVLNISLSRDAYGQIVFENDIATRRETYRDGAINGFYYFAEHIGDTIRYGNGWNLAASTITQGTRDGLPEIPSNLQANPDFEEPTFLSRNQWFEHFASILSNQEDFTGEAYSANNWRDTARDLSLGTFILQHRAPLLKTMLLASSSEFSFLDAISFVENQYTRFRSKFVQKINEYYNSGQFSESDDPGDWVDEILVALKSSKNGEFSFALSTMAGGQFFIPATPSAMGMYPVYTPRLEIDESFFEPITFVRGHDGSRVPAFGDFRDNILITLETRIFDSIPEKFRTTLPVFDIANFMSGKYRSVTDLSYSREEVTRILAPHFERWSQINNADYRENNEYDPENPFTWNFSTCLDRQGATLPGHWRGIYFHYFDTDRPNLAPWEMLGLPSKPSWWDARYGVAPYTSGNVQLWTDIAAGRIAEGPYAGIRPLYVRPNLMASLPVNQSGDLLDPYAAGIVEHPPLIQDATRPWTIGDCGPVEMLWRISPTYRFALMAAAYLMKPARFVEDCWNTDTRLLVHNTQWIDSSTQNRPRHADLSVHGEFVDDAYLVVNGIQQWIADLIVDRGQSPSLLGDAVRGVGVRLGHKMAAFTSKDDLRVTAENFGIIPAEDITVQLYRSPAIRSEFYSGVLIEWTGVGWRVIGYDPTGSTFTIMPGNPNAEKLTIATSGSKLPIVLTWRPSTYYAAGSRISHQGQVFLAERSHTSSATFEQSFWSSDPATAKLLRNTASVRKLIVPTGEIKTVNYGTIFETRQDVADFIFAYERWLESRGWKFDALDDGASVPNDWTGSVRQFLAWAQIEWEPGNFIALSPSASKVKFHTDHGTIVDVDSVSYAFIERTGMPINRRDRTVDRLDGDVEISGRGVDIFGARLQVNEIEHAVLFSNKTIFNDSIYEPIYNLRQQRLRISGSQTSDWAGRIDAPGYILIDNDIKPNFDRSAENIRTMFDIERAEDVTLRDHARHVIGYQSREYLSQLGMGETEQFEFYQGLIQQKGSAGSFNKILRSNAVGQNRDLRFLEEWAFNIGSYGAYRSRVRFDFSLHSSDIRRQPQFIHFRAGDIVRRDWVQFGPNDSRWIDQPQALSFPLLSRTAPLPEASLPSMGYARVDDIAHFVFHQDDLEALYAGGTKFAFGETIMVHETDKLTWTVLQLKNISATGIQNRITVIETEEDDEDIIGTRLTFASAHGLTSAAIGSTIFIDGFPQGSPDISGFRRIRAIDTGWIEIDDSVEDGYEYADYSQTGPVAYRLADIRFSSYASLLVAPNLYPVNGDLAYVDNDGNGTWAVYRRTSPSWEQIRRQPRRIDNSMLKSARIYDQKTLIDKDSISPTPMVLDHLTIIDPIAGLIPGIAEKEIDFKLEYDPARYSGGREWGAEHVGFLWWDIASVRFIDCNTDDVFDESADTARYIDEINYRVANWSRIAPATSMNIYEWVRSTLSPDDWIDAAVDDTTGFYSGTVLGGDDARYVEREEFDSDSGRVSTFYYFWVGNRTVAPQVEGRKLSALTIGKIISNPSGENIPYVAPITPEGMIIGGAMSFLDDTGTCLTFEIAATNYDGVEHREWELVSPEDETSQAPEGLWRKMIDSLVGFDRIMQAVPDPTLHQSMITGVQSAPRQNMFGDAASVRDARKSLVQMINYIFGRTNMVVDRPSALSAMSRETAVPDRLVWTQADGSNYIEFVPPSAEWDGRHVYTAEARDAFLITREFALALGAIPYDSVDYDTTGWDYDLSDDAIENGPRLRILLDNTSADRPQWSVWELNREVDRPTSDLDALARANEFLIPARTFDYDVGSFAARNALVDAATDPIQEGDRVLVRGTTETNGFWTIWRYEPNNLLAAGGFILTNAQTYRTDDFWFYADWYADGYGPTNPPVVTYQTVAEFNLAQSVASGDNFVRVNDDGNGNFIWMALVNSAWVAVAHQNGTIQLSERFYESGYDVYGWANGDYSLDLSKIENRDGSIELRVLFDIMRDHEVLTALELNELWFSMVHHVHAKNDQVDWAFKTSFLSIAGYNEPLLPTPVEMPDNTVALLAYLDEVKPYRVKIRDFVRTLAPEIDEAQIDVQEIERLFTLKMVFDRIATTDVSDATLSHTLDANATTVIALRNPDSVIAFNSPAGSFWIGGEKVEYTSLTVSGSQITFGGITRGATILAHSVGSAIYSGKPDILSAAARIMNFYQPGVGMREKTLNTLLNLDFKGTVLDGSTLLGQTSDWGIGGYDLIEYDEVRDIEYDIEIDGTAGSNDDVINPRINGQAGYGLVDPLANPNHPAERVSLLVSDTLNLRVQTDWGFGAPEQTVKSYDVSRRKTASWTFSVPQIAQTNEAVLVFRDGIRARPGIDYTVNQMTRSVQVNLTFYDTTRVKKVDIHTFGVASGTQVRGRRFFNASGQTVFAVAGASLHSIEIVVDGLRIPSANFTVSGDNITINSPITGMVMIVLHSPGLASEPYASVRVRELLWNAPQSWTLDRPSTVSFAEHSATIVEVDGFRIRPPETHWGDLALVRFIALNNVPVSNANVKIWVNGVLYGGSLVTGSWATIEEVLAVSTPNTFAIWQNYIVCLDATMMSKIVVSLYENHDYTVQGGVLVIPNAIPTTSRVIVTTFRRGAEDGVRTYVMKPNSDGKYILPVGLTSPKAWVTVNGRRLTEENDYEIRHSIESFDEIPFDEAPFDVVDPAAVLVLRTPLKPADKMVVTTFIGRTAREPRVWQHSTTVPDIARLRPKGLAYELQPGAWEKASFDPLYNRGVLINDLLPLDDEIVINCNPDSLPSAMLPSDPFDIPNTDKNRPGVIWIGHERIEYFEIEHVGSTITLTQIRRGTRGTSGALSFDSGTEVLVPRVQPKP